MNSQSNTLAIEIGSALQSNITLTPAEFIDLQKAIYDQTITFGYIAAIVAFAIGICVGWSWCRWKYGRD